MVSGSAKDVIVVLLCTLIRPKMADTGNMLIKSFTTIKDGMVRLVVLLEAPTGCYRAQRVRSVSSFGVDLHKGLLDLQNILVREVLGQ